MNALHFAPRFSLSALALAAALALAGCAVGPRYEQPTTALPANWKEQQTAEGWLPAAPADALDRGEWWKLFNDATLDDLAGRVQVSNQNIAAAVANYSQAQALVRGERAALFPSVRSTARASARGNVGGSSNGGASPSNAFSASLGASWTPDVWGRLREAVSSAQANAQASEADLAAARLSAIGDLAINYFSLREADAEIVLLDETIQGYQRAFDITSNRYAAGIAAQTDVLQAQTQLVNAKADRVGLQRSRATLRARHRHAAGRGPGRLQPAGRQVDAQRAGRADRRALDPAAAPARHRRGRAHGGLGQCADRHCAGGVLSEHQPHGLGGQQREPREGPVQLGQHAVVARLLGGAGGVRRGRHRAPTSIRPRPATNRAWRATARPCSPPSRRWKTS
jgi:outer membrane protein TolC